MKQDSASATARTIAAAVLVAAREPTLTSLVSPDADAWSERFLEHSRGGPLLIRSIRSAIGRRAWRLVESVVQPGIIRHWLARKRWIEREVERAIAEGTRRCIVIAAGLDTLGVRCSLRHPAVEVIEIDHPATQSIKRAAFANQPPLRLLPCDLSREALPVAALGGEAPTIVVMEGVLMYLEREAVRQLMTRLLELPASNLRVVASFMVAPAGCRVGFRPRSRLMTLIDVTSLWLRMVSEPFRSALEPGEADRFFASIASDRHTWRRVGFASSDMLQELGGSSTIAEGEELVVCERSSRDK